MRKRVYIAGPISQGDLATNIEAASAAFFELLRAGFAPFCPHWSAYSGGPYHAPMPEVQPSGTCHEDWMDADIPWVVVADAVLRLPGESQGADREVQAAEAYGIPVFYSVARLKWEFLPILEDD